MSWPALSWAVRQRLPSSQKLVLLMLAERHNKDSGQCNPSLELLAEDCGLSRRSVIDQVAKLQEAGYLTVRHRARDNIKLPSQYVLHLHFGIPEKVQTEGFDPYLLPEKVVNHLHQGSEPAAPGVVKHVPLVVNHLHQGSEPAAHKPGIEPGKNQEERTIIGAGAPKAQAKRATVLPNDFHPDETAERLAQELGVSVDSELAAFCDHHSAKGTTFKDWQAGFRTWLRNASKFRQQRQGGAPRIAPTPKSFAQTDREEGWARWEQMSGRPHPDRLAQQPSKVIDITPRGAQPLLEG